jgi:hypothetical protein
MQRRISKRVIGTLAISATLAASAFALAGGSSALAREAERRGGSDDPSQSPSASPTATATATGIATASPSLSPTGAASASPTATGTPRVSPAGAAATPSASSSPLVDDRGRGGEIEPRHGADDPIGHR